MANLSETATYDAGVYQLETTDPVVGGASGVSNSPQKNLANRTAYLKQHVDNLESGATVPPGIATLASPAFTGSPTAPTQALGDNSTKIANDAFVQGTIGGVLVKSVAGGSNVTLTAVEAGNGILKLTGLITANIAVIVPTSPTRGWQIWNATTGAFTLTVKTASGAGVVVTQGTMSKVFTDGTDVLLAQTDFISPALTGNPTAPTQAQFDNSTKLATTAFMRANSGSTPGISTYVTSQTLPLSDVGKWVFPTTTGLTLTIPAASGTPIGSVIRISGNANGATLARTGTDVLSTMNGTNLTSYVLNKHETVDLVNVTGSGWYMLGGSNLTFGYGQTWQNVLGSRASGTTYTNTTGKPIMVLATGQAVSGWPTITVVVDGVTIDTYSFPYGTGNPVTFVVPPNSTYSVTYAAGTGMSSWCELR